MRLKPVPADCHGILLLDKPLGFSSNQALQKVRRYFGKIRAGHTGSLDPLASGMLPVCLGEATKIAGLLLGESKVYRAEVALGVTTTTADAEGEVLSRRPVPAVDAATLDAVLARFVGLIQQRPPAYSAIKIQGRPAYELARRGEAVEMAVRTVQVMRLSLMARSDCSLTLEVACGSGTYIRSLARDIGEALGCGAHLSALRRTWVAPFEACTMVSFEQLAEAFEAGQACRLVLPIEAGLAGLPEVVLDAGESRRLRHGHAVQRPAEAWTGPCRMVDDQGRLSALGRRDDAGTVQPARVFLWA